MAAPRPFRLRILDNLTAALRAVNPTAGYHHDLAEAVFRGRSMYGEGDPVPMVSILESPNNDDSLLPSSGGASSVVRWNLLVQGFVDDDRHHPSDPAHFLMADVKRALQAERKRGGGPRPPDILSMGPRITELLISPGVVRPADEHVSDKANFWLPVTIVFAENMDDPYQ
jgi:hypothetical protein